MKVIAIDPGYDRLGIAVLEMVDGKEHLLHSECFETNKAETLTERSRAIGDTFNTLLTTYSPDTLAIETLFFNKNVKTALGVAQVRGVLIYLAQTNNCAVYEFSPQEIKIATTGYGNSDKASVIGMVQRLIENAPTKVLDDEYDAIAIGITCLAHHGRT